MFKKISKIIIFLFIVVSLIIVFAYPKYIEKTFKLTLEIWLDKVLISLVPIYFVSNLLLSYPYFSKLLYPLLDKVMHFENQKACSLFYLGILIGQPTSSYLITNAYLNNELSLSETKRLVSASYYFNPLFVILVLGLKWGIYYLIISILINSLMYYNKKVPKLIKNEHSNLHLLEIIDNCPKVMLNILSVMIFINLFKIPFTLINQNIIFRFLLDNLEIATGLNSLNYYPLNPLLIILLKVIMLSFGGLAINLQSYQALNKTGISFIYIIKGRIINCILCSLLFFMIFSI